MMPLLASGVMRLFRRRRDLGLRPASELHDEVMKRPDAEKLLAEADEYWRQRERDYAAQAEAGSAAGHKPGN